MQRSEACRPGVPTKSAAVGLAAAVGTYDNTLRATVESGAIIDAAEAVHVASKVSFPSLSGGKSFRKDKFKPDDPDTGDFAETITNALNGRGGLDQVFNVWVNSSSTATDFPVTVSVTGSVGMVAFTTVSEAVIQSGALINQIRNAPAQTVSVDADNTLDLMNLAGNVKLELDPARAKDIVREFKKNGSSPISLISNQAGRVGLGGSALYQSIDTTTTAHIDSGAKVRTGSAGGLTVDAKEQGVSLSIVQAGGASGTFGVSGSVSVLEHTSQTTATLANGVKITGGPIAVTASSDLNYYNLAGATQVAGVVGVGASGAVTRVNRETNALIGTAAGSLPDTAGTDIATTRLTVAAKSTGDMVTVSVVGAVAEPGTATKLSGAAQSKLPLPVAVAVAGAVSVNEGGDTTRAFVNDTGLITVGDGAFDVIANNDTRIIAVTGSLALAAKKTVSVALAGAVTINTLDSNTEAFVTGSTLSNAAP
ncbi:hypothetical protein BH11PLA2_BH11PLA2_26940 [soil metagenome]